MATDRQATPLEDLHLADLDPQDQIAANFRVYELTRSEVADRLGIDNSLSADAFLRGAPALDDAEAMRAEAVRRAEAVLGAAVHLAREVMQPMRRKFGRFSPSSVYRCQALEQVLKKRPTGWISTSLHTTGCACDLDIPGKATLYVAQWAAEHLPAYDQIVCECCDPRQGPNSGWVHVALRPQRQEPERRELSSYVLDTRTLRWVRVPGLCDAVP
jgi:hypothetical protein